MNGSVRLTGFGLAPIISGPGFTTNATPDAVRNCRWLAPELINPCEMGGSTCVVESKPADVYAFGMVVCEVIACRMPFEEQKDEAVILHVLKGGRPELPANAQEIGLTVQMWDLLHACWDSDPKKRPTMDEVMRIWKKFTEGDVTTCVQFFLRVWTQPSFHPQPLPRLLTFDLGNHRHSQSGEWKPIRSRRSCCRIDLPVSYFPRQDTDPQY